MRRYQIKGVIEKSKDGLYSIYSDEHFGDSYFGGFGESVAAAKKDFIESVNEAIAEETAAGRRVPSLEEVTVEYRYDIPSFFNFFDFINVSKFAEHIGINESKMRAYKSGVSYPGEKTTGNIANEIHELGAELLYSSI